MTLRLSPVISAYPDDKYESHLIEVILPGIEKAVAKYSNGILKVSVPGQQPLEKLVDVKIV